jgi:uncharacterized repeat protein (TIGR01451 family)
MRKMPLLMLLAALTVCALIAQRTPSAAGAPLFAITDTPSPTAPPPTETPQPTATSTALPPTGTVPSPADPAPAAPELVIGKSASAAQASQGDLVDFTLTVSNPHVAAVPGAVVVDVLAPELDFLGASAPQGSFAYDPGSRAVTFALGQVAPGQTLQLVVQTRLNALAQPPAEVRNVAHAQPGQESNLTVVVVVPPALPSTGAGPGRVELLNYGLAITAALLFVVAASGWVAERRRR